MFSIFFSHARLPIQIRANNSHEWWYVNKDFFDDRSERKNYSNFSSNCAENEKKKEHKKKNTSGSLF